MNMREAFGAWSVFPETDCRNSWDAFQAGAAFAARECAEIAKDRQYNLMPDERAHDAIREAFPEAFRD